MANCQVDDEANDYGCEDEADFAVAKTNTTRV
jgi:hypothetical protein